jgi:N-methylhydantoinase A
MCNCTSKMTLSASDPTAARYRVALDIGGTFTDAVAYDEHTGAYAAGKSSTTPADLTEGVFGALSTVVAEPGEIAFAVHGTTQGLNAFLERRGVRVLLLATAGAGDVLHVARGDRTGLYDLHYRKPQALIPRRDVVEIGGRLDYAGAEIEPLDEDAVRAAGRRAREEDFGGIAVAFLFSYLDPGHELRAAEILAEEAPGVSLSMSHRVAREWREYERTSSTVLDAYVAPIVRRYLNRLTGQMVEWGMDVPMHVMQSNGGIVSVDTAADDTLQTLLSGPAGGTMGGAALARLTDRRNLICVDMGGTSFDVSLVIDGRPDVSTEAELEGLPVLMPVVNIHTVGAGGGSLAYEEAGGLRVGPRSAGADPGPACYGRGGTQPTVTDANVVLGRVDPSWFAGGQMALDTAAAETAVAGLAETLGLGTLEMADGICAVINAKMAQAIRTLTVEQGVAPSDFALVAFGGAGPMHAAFLARELEIPETIVPRFPGAFSAWGMLETEIRKDFTRSFVTHLADLDAAGLGGALADQDAEARAALSAEGIADDAARVEHAVDVRYVGQEYTLTIPLTGPGEPLGGAFSEALQGRFDDAHLVRFGHCNPGAPVELVAARSTGLGDLGRAAPRPLAEGELAADAGLRQPVVFDGEPVDALVVRRDDLPAGSRLSGPAVVVEPTATTVVPPGMTLEVDRYGSLVIHADAQEARS